MIPLLLVFALGVAPGPTRADSISQAVARQIELCPAVHYRDIYKLYMQDYFGPGHMVADTTAAGAYLRREMNEAPTLGGPLYEPTGHRGEFVRVNLSAVKSGLVPYEVFFNAFVESVNSIQPPGAEEWRAVWCEVDSVMTASGITFPDEDAERKALAVQCAEGNFIGRHSEDYNKAMQYHYRIISRPIFEQRILPLLGMKNDVEKNRKKPLPFR